MPGRSLLAAAGLRGAHKAVVSSCLRCPKSEWPPEMPGQTRCSGHEKHTRVYRSFGTFWSDQLLRDRSLHS